MKTVRCLSTLAPGKDAPVWISLPVGKVSISRQSLARRVDVPVALLVDLSTQKKAISTLAHQARAWTLTQANLSLVLKRLEDFVNATQCSKSTSGAQTKMTLTSYFNLKEPAKMQEKISSKIIQLIKIIFCSRRATFMIKISLLSSKTAGKQQQLFHQQEAILASIVT